MLYKRRARASNLKENNAEKFKDTAHKWNF